MKDFLHATLSPYILPDPAGKAAGLPCAWFLEAEGSLYHFLLFLLHSYLSCLLQALNFAASGLAPFFR